MIRTVVAHAQCATDCAPAALLAGRVLQKLIMEGSAAAEGSGGRSSETDDGPPKLPLETKAQFIGNVSKLIPLPTSHTGGVRKGHLQFNACFECGESD